MEVQLGIHGLSGLQLVEARKSDSMAVTRRLPRYSNDKISDALDLYKASSDPSESGIAPEEVFTAISTRFVNSFRKRIPVVATGIFLLNPFNEGGVLYSGRVSLPEHTKGDKANYLYNQRIVDILTDDNGSDLTILARQASASMIGSLVFGNDPGQMHTEVDKSVTNIRSDLLLKFITANLMTVTVGGLSIPRYRTT